ncbi:hypothetical protein CIPAW_05G166500 [Carya illinoinensis]|uniref:AP5B1 middle domain-containing protein n=1 Tax=Carya illinoinensis TaxID=32201 RepID=A0A8T1QKT4_CARIL|nr:hypothetical protein CIPAW_05G166500 [Carya illinoinensis]
MTDIPPAAFKPVSPQDWETLIDDFQYGGLRRHKWTTLSPVLLDLALSSILKRDFPLKLHLLLFLEEFSDSFLLEPISLDRLLDSLRLVIQSPADGFHITLPLKDQFLVSTTSIFISLDVFNKFDIRYAESLVELLLIIVNRPNHGPDRQTRAVACECLRELERFYPCLLSDIAGHLWSLCQNERTHASQSYILLFTLVIHNIVALESNVSVLNTSVPLVPFNVPQSLLAGGSSNSTNTCLNYKELRRAMAFLLESPQVLTPCGMVEFMAMITPVAISLELQPSMLKVQFFGMVYSYNPILCHVVLMLYLRFMDAFDGQESEIARRLMLMSREAQHYLVFRLLALHWLMGFNELISSREVKKKKAMAVEMRLSFYPRVFDPLALKALKLDLLAFCSICIESLKSESASDAGKSVDKLFGDGLVSVSAFKWLPPGSTETAVAFRAFREFLIGGSSHSATDPSTIRTLLESTIFNTLQQYGRWSQYAYGGAFGGKGMTEDLGIVSKGYGPTILKWQEDGIFPLVQTDIGQIWKICLYVLVKMRTYFNQAQSALGGVALKYEMVSVEDVRNINCLADLLSYKVASLPMKYLGLLLGASFKAKNIWDGVVEKIEKSLAGWKRLYLSKGGRITLIKGTPSNLPIAKLRDL